MPKPRLAVYCNACGWKGRRVAGDCACYDEWAMYCSCVWGLCPKCKYKVSLTKAVPFDRSRRHAAKES